MNHPSHSRPGPVFPAQVLRDRMTEDAFQAWVIEQAKTFGWLHYHTRYSKYSPRGFPDLVLVRNGWLIFAELKSERGHMSTEQRIWQAQLARVAQRARQFAGSLPEDQTARPVREFLWRPSDMELIVEVLW